MSTHQGSLDCTPGTERLQARGATDLEKPLGSIHCGLPHGGCSGGSGSLCTCGGGWTGSCWGQGNAANPLPGSREVISASSLSPLQLPPSLSLSSGQTSHCLWLPLHLSPPSSASLTFPLTHYLFHLLPVSLSLSVCPPVSQFLFLSVSTPLSLSLLSPFPLTVPSGTPVMMGKNPEIPLNRHGWRT